MGPKPSHSTGLTQAEEARIVTFRRHPLLPLADGLSAWPAPMPQLTRSARHRWLQRHAISRLPASEGDTPQQHTGTPSPLGSCHRDIAEGRTDEGQLDLAVAIARTSTFASAELHTEAITTGAAQVRRPLLARRPAPLHPVLTAHGLQYPNRKKATEAFTHLHVDTFTINKTSLI
jgi:hypothetical protein